MLIRFSKYSSFSKCLICLCLVLLLSGTLDPNRRAELLAELHCHRVICYNERKCLHYDRQMSVDTEWHVCVMTDWMDKFKVRLPGLSMRTAKGAGVDDVKFVQPTVGIVMIFGYGTFYFVADSTVPGNANLNLEMLNIALQRMFATRCREGKPTPISVSEYMDGAPVNRCATVLGFLQLLVKSGLLSKAQLDIMLMGHSHELGDQNFGSVSHHFKSKGIVLRDVTDLMREIPNAFTDEKLKPRDVIKIDVVHDWTAWLRPYIGQIANIKGLVPDIQRVHHLECHPDGIWYKQLQQDNGYWNRKPLDVLPYGVPEWSDLKLQLPSNHDGMKKHLKTEAQVQLNFFKLWNSHEHFRTAKHIFTQELRAHYEAYFAEFSEIRVVHNEKQKRWKDREATATGKHKGHTRVADEEGSGEAAAAANVKGTSDTDTSNAGTDASDDEHVDMKGTEATKAVNARQPKRKRNRKQQKMECVVLGDLTQYEARLIAGEHKITIGSWPLAKPEGTQRIFKDVIRPVVAIAPMYMVRGKANPDGVKTVTEHKNEVLSAFIDGADDHAAVKEGRAALLKLFTGKDEKNGKAKGSKANAPTTVTETASKKMMKQRAVQEATKQVLHNIHQRNPAALTPSEKAVCGASMPEDKDEAEEDMALGDYQHLVFGVHKHTFEQGGEDCFDIMVGIEYEEKDLQAGEDMRQWVRLLHKYESFGEFAKILYNQNSDSETVWVQWGEGGWYAGRAEWASQWQADAGQWSGTVEWQVTYETEGNRKIPDTDMLHPGSLEHKVVDGARGFGGRQRTGWLLHDYEAYAYEGY